MFPGPRSRVLLEEFGRYVIADLWPFVLDLEKSRGMLLATVDGQEVFDWAGFYGSKLLGHNHAHPLLRDPAYLRRLVTAASNKTANPDFLTPECLDYYRMLHEVAPVCMRNPELEVYTLNSGAEAVENMMKYFINLHDQKALAAGRMPGARRFIYFDEAFHGRTVYALNVTKLSGSPVITKDFHGFIPGNLQVPFPALDADRPAAENEALARRSLETVSDLLKRYKGEVVGIIVEPLQGAGGHRMAVPEFFRGLSALAASHDAYLGFDEVQTAGGQTGTMFACDQFGLPHPPQAVAVAKKFGCGAVYMLRPMQDRGVLDSTWGGHVADMVRVVAEFSVVREERLIEAVAAKAGRLAGGLRALQARHPERMGNVRGMGLYQGFSLESKALRDGLLDAMLEKESTLLLGAGPDTVRLRPPITVSDAEIDLLLEKLGRVFPSL
ncbi:MAG: aminotransferase class III-fold pyridoxal phosphate-dependent enzyme [Elusimicrobiota bacterium]|jgi:L-lysine 6-transaminase